MKKENGFWKTVEIPVYVIVLYTILALPLTANSMLPSAVMTALGLLIPVAAFAYIGYLVKKGGGATGKAAKYGALAGVIVGLASALISIAAWNFYPQVYEAAINQAVQNLPAGVSRDDIMALMPISIYASLVTAPLMDAILGAIAAAIAGAATPMKKRK